VAAEALSRRFRDWQILRAPPPSKDGAFFEASDGTRNPRLGPALSAIAISKRFGERVAFSAGGDGGRRSRELPAAHSHLR
jgi:hypothetical protein